MANVDDETLGVRRLNDVTGKRDDHSHVSSNGGQVDAVCNHVDNGDDALSNSANDTTLYESIINPETESALSTETDFTANSSGSITDMEDNDIDSEGDADALDESFCEQDTRGIPLARSQRQPWNDQLTKSLPETVTVLETPDGSRVFLVGTAHFSLESQEDVAKTIQAAQPDIVVVELCKGRVNILKLDEQTILEEAKNLNLEKMRLTIKQNGFVHGVMYLFLLSMSAHLTKQLGMAPGGEFRRAFSEARKVPGCLVHLGDRPIQVTLQRAINELSIWQKLCLAWGIITSKEPISKEEVERCKKRDLLEEMIAEMTGKFPAFSRVFLQERDIYLTHSLQLAASPVPCRDSDTGMMPTVVVGVVGIGHVPGIVKHWGQVVAEDIPPLLRIPESSRSSVIFRYTMKASLWGLLAYGCYRVAAKPSYGVVMSLYSMYSLPKSK